MRVGPGLALLIPSGLVFVTAVLVGRGRRPRRWIDDLPVAVAGAGLGLGALMFQADVSVTAWWLTPVVVATLAVVHVRAMLAGEGPLRV